MIKLIVIGSFYLGFSVTESREVYPNYLEAIEEETKQLEIEAKAGTYPVVIEYYDGNSVISTTILVNVIGTNTHTFESQKIALDASNIQVTVDEVKTLTPDKVLRLCKASAWSMLNGSALPVMIEGELRVDEVEGIYPVVISTVNQLSMIIEVEVVANIDPYIAQHQTGLNKGYGYALIWMVLIGSWMPLLLFHYEHHQMKKMIKAIASLYRRKP